MDMDNSKKCSELIYNININYSDNMLDTNEYFILYLDFLGSKNRIVDDEIKSLNQIYDLYSNTISVIRYLNSVSHNNGYPIPQYYTKIFSDNIIIAMK